MLLRGQMEILFVSLALRFLLDERTRKTPEAHLMTSVGVNSTLPFKLLGNVTLPPVTPGGFMSESTSALRHPSGGDGDVGTGGEETGEGLRGRYGERATDSSFWEASSAETASELSWCTVA